MNKYLEQNNLSKLHHSIEQETQSMILVKTLDLIKYENDSDNNNVHTLKRATYNLIFKPPKFIYPYKIHRLFGDLILQENDNQIDVGFRAINHIKRISSIINNKENGMIEILLEDNGNYPIIPTQYVIERFKSFGFPEAKNWAEALARHWEIIEEFKKQEFLKNQALEQSKIEISEEIQAKKAKSVKMLSTKKRNIIENIILSTNSICVEFTNQKTWAMTKIIISSGFIKMLRYTHNEFIELIKKEGLPDIFPLYNPIRSIKQQNTLRDPLCKKSIIQTNGDLIDAQENTIPVTEYLHYFQDTDLNGVIHDSAIMVFKPKAGRKGKRNPLCEKRKQIMRTEIDNSNDHNKEIKEFFKKNYNINHSHYEDEERLCKFKKLSS